MIPPTLPQRQREAFSLVYTRPRRVTDVSRTLGMSWCFACEVLSILVAKKLIVQDGHYYRPAPEVFA